MKGKIKKLHSSSQREGFISVVFINFEVPCFENLWRADALAAGDSSEGPRHALAVQLKHVAVRSPSSQNMELQNL